MVYRDESAPDNPIGHLMTIRAMCLSQSFFCLALFEEMAGKTDIVVHIEVFISFKMAMAHAARDSYPIHHFSDVVFVGELDLDVVNVVCSDFFNTMTCWSHAGGIDHRRIRLLADSADHTIHGLSQAVNLAFHIAGKAGL